MKNITLLISFLSLLFIVSLFSKLSYAQTCRGGPVEFRSYLVTWNCSFCKSEGVKLKKCSSACAKVYSCPAGGRTSEKCADYDGTSYNTCYQISHSGDNYDCHTGSCTWNPPPSGCSGGYYCDGVAVTGSHGQTGVCGGSNINYGCNDGTWYSQGTFCNRCGQSITTNSIGEYPGLVGNLGWSAVSNITRYRLRIDDAADGWIVSGQCPNGWTGYDYCGDLGTNSFSWTAIAGHSYHWWVDACGANNVCTAASSADVTAPSAPVPVNGACGATNNACNAGTLSDTADSSTQYLWSCLGSSGGSNASCSLNKPINGVCSATHNNCSSGTSSDTPDSPTQYLWGCLGLYGGSTASCSENIPLPAYYKLKDTSFYKLSLISSDFPPSYSCPASRYDNSDICTGGYFNQGEAGMVVARGNTISAGASGGNVISGSVGNTRNWTATNYQGANSFNPTSYYSYILARKNAVPVPDIGGIPASGTGGIYTLPSGNVTVLPSTTFAASYVTVIVNGDLTLSTGNLNRDGIMFVVNGDVTINGVGAAGRFNSSNRPFSLISTGTITFANTLTEANGLYVGTDIDFGTGATPLKITGNVSSSNPSSFGRDRGSSAPSMFIVFDPRHYLNIIDKVSTVKTSWRQIQ